VFFSEHGVGNKLKCSESNQSSQHTLRFQNSACCYLAATSAFKTTYTQSYHLHHVWKKHPEHYQ